MATLGDAKREWTRIDETHYRCPWPECKAVLEITKPSGKESPKECENRLDWRLTAHLDEHKAKLEEMEKLFPPPGRKPNRSAER